MAVIELRKRAKYAGDVHAELLKLGCPNCGARMDGDNGN